MQPFTKEWKNVSKLCISPRLKKKKKKSVKPVVTETFLFSIFPFPSLAFPYLEFALWPRLHHGFELSARPENHLPFSLSLLPPHGSTAQPGSIVTLVRDTVMHCLDGSWQRSEKYDSTSALDQASHLKVFILVITSFPDHSWSHWSY